MKHQAGHLRGPAAAFAAAVLVASVGACAGDSGDDPPAPPDPPATTAEPTATLDPVHQQILDVYRGSVAAMVAAQQAGDPDHPDLTKYFADGTQALLNVQSGIRNNEQRDTYYEGSLDVVSAEVTELDPDAKPPSASIQACVDYTDYRLVHRKDASPVPDAEQLGRYVVVATTLQGADGRWLIVTSDAHWDTPC